MFLNGFQRFPSIFFVVVAYIHSEILSFAGRSQTIQLFQFYF